MEWQYYIFALVYLIFLLFFQYLIDYFRAKAKNEATKEDIEEITDLIEKTKASYLKELEELKGDIKITSQIIQSSVDSSVHTRQGFITHQAEAIKQIWNEMITLRKKINPIIVTLDIAETSPASKQMYEKNSSNIPGLKELNIINSSKKFIEFHNKIEPHRVFIGEQIWNFVKNYYYFLVHIELLVRKGLSENKKLPDWYEDEEAKMIADSIIPDEREKLFSYKGNGHLQLTINAIEQKILNETYKVITGQEAVETTLQQSSYIWKLQKEMNDKDIDSALMIQG